MKAKSTFREYAEAIIMALVLALFIRTFIVQAFKIPSGSMIPTLADRRSYPGQQIVLRFAHAVFGTLSCSNIGNAERGDVVVFIFPEDRSKDFIKRVIGVAGDTVEVRGKKVFINGKQVEDPLRAFRRLRSRKRARSGSGDDYGPKVVPENHIFRHGRQSRPQLRQPFLGLCQSRTRCAAKRS